jgi:hypothetical protein
MALLAIKLLAQYTARRVPAVSPRLGGAPFAIGRQPRCSGVNKAASGPLTHCSARNAAEDHFGHEQPQSAALAAWLSVLALASGPVRWLHATLAASAHAISCQPTNPRTLRPRSCPSGWPTRRATATPTCASSPASSSRRRATRWRRSRRSTMAGASRSRCARGAGRDGPGRAGWRGRWRGCRAVPGGPYCNGPALVTPLPLTPAAPPPQDGAVHPDLPSDEPRRQGGATSQGRQGGCERPRAQAGTLLDAPCPGHLRPPGYFRASACASDPTRRPSLMRGALCWPPPPKGHVGD